MFPSPTGYILKLFGFDFYWYEVAYSWNSSKTIGNFSEVFNFDRLVISQTQSGHLQLPVNSPLSLVHLGRLWRRPCRSLRRTWKLTHHKVLCKSHRPWPPQSTLPFAGSSVLLAMRFHLLKKVFVIIIIIIIKGKKKESRYWHELFGQEGNIARECSSLSSNV